MTMRPCIHAANLRWARMLASSPAVKVLRKLNVQILEEHVL